MTIADLALEQLRHIIKEAVIEALEEQSQTNDETRVWLEASAGDLARGLELAGADTPPEELADWLNAVEKVVKPLDAVSV